MKETKVSEVLLKISEDVSWESFKHALTHAYEHEKGEVEIKGFRKGQVPFELFVKKFGYEVLYESAFNHLLSHIYRDISEENRKLIAGKPVLTFDVKTIKPEENFVFEFEVALEPKVYGDNYKGIEVQLTKEEVTKEALDLKVKEVLKENGELVLKDTPVLESGDEATFDFKGYINDELFDGGSAENYTLTIGSNQFIPGFEDQMVGMKLEETRDINLKFPTEYKEDLAGKDVKFVVTLHEIKVTKLPELTDEFVSKLKENSAKTVEEFEKALSEKVLSEIKETNEKVKEDELVKGLLSNFEVVYHESLEGTEIENFRESVAQQAQNYKMDLEMFLSMNGLDKEAFEKMSKERAEKTIKYQAILDKIAQLENVTPKEEEVNARLEENRKHLSKDEFEYYKDYILEDIKVSLKRHEAYLLVLNNLKVTYK
ncbi:MAG: trigger factor [Acholeplasmatales bacterium]|jgi:trigger factor|nr:trigger factor [Acholeplasmatales bacterium]